ncbi:aldolase [Bacillus sp. BRMEA1]|uniref:aldolase n=1 Tax=Neobacillus endophyticus TaxID=2738405 RepID=UPI00156403D8|nr:aldolase [Neobacillus endophyticus]NRD76974.1 aldolase [Neobacillus endophyticus]
MMYKAFGFTMMSEIPLPELKSLERPVDLIDIEITMGDLKKEWQAVSKEEDIFVITKDRILFQLNGIAIFSIKKGKQITVSPLEGYSEEVARLWILGTCMGAILMQRKILSLHGSVIAIDGKAYAIVGHSGAGKSTLASAFLNRGFHLLTDDVIAVSFSEENVPYVTPSYPQQKLWIESMEQFGMDEAGYQPLIDRETKFAVPVSTQFMDTPLPLAGIFELVKDDVTEINIQPIGSLLGLHKLFLHTYRNFFLEHSGLLEWHFQMTAKLVNKLDLYQLRRPVTPFTAYELIDLILETIKVEEKVYA